MMKSEIKTFRYPDGDIQRVQIVRWDSWNRLDFLTPLHSPKALDCFAEIYRNYLVPAAPWLFGHMILFHLPVDFSMDLSLYSGSFGSVSSPLTAAAAILKDGVSIHGRKPVFRRDAARKLWFELEEKGCIRIVSGKLPITKIIPVSSVPGFLSESAADATLKVNASFFIMDCFDCATVFDHVGIPFGLCVKNGSVLHPPLYNREALLVRQDGTVSIRQIDITDLELEIGGCCFQHGKNASIYSRPANSRAPAGKKNYYVITGSHVASISTNPPPIPASGFVLCPHEQVNMPVGSAVVYHGLEDIRFGIQVGNSILKDGIPTDRFYSRFYHIRRLEPVPFPPSLYPMNFSKDRASRIALGADSDGKPVLIWAEGAAKIGHQKGLGSCGASLQEMAQICKKLDIRNAVNLDGGGSAQILLHNQRQLQISDRNPQTIHESERPIPLALMIK